MEREDKLNIFKNKGWSYLPDTGEIYSHTGRLITGKNKFGYIFANIQIDGKMITVTAQQLAYFLHYNMVASEIDHINCVKDDNRISNLRSVTRQHNQWNIHNAKGAYILPNGRYKASIFVNNQRIHLGCFDTKEQAQAEYKIAKQKYHTII